MEGGVGVEDGVFKIECGAKWRTEEEVKRIICPLPSSFCFHDDPRGRESKWDINSR